MSTDATEENAQASSEPEKVPPLSHPSDRGECGCEHDPDGGAELPTTKGRFLFFAIVSAAVLLLDIASKVWAVATLVPRGSYGNGMVVIKDHLTFVLAYNQGGAWGFFHDAPSYLRRPFFVLVSLVAIGFIVSLYRRVQPGQWTLTWGLPLVLGGALGNLTDRVTRVGVVDFVDYRAGWVETMNQLIAKVAPQWTVTDHWPTYNVADIAICIGVGLMALDVLLTRRCKAGSGRRCASGAGSVPSPHAP